MEKEELFNVFGIAGLGLIAFRAFWARDIRFLDGRGLGGQVLVLTALLGWF